MDLSGLLLVTPERQDTWRHQVATAWKDYGGQVLELARFWDPPRLDRAKARCYGGEIFCRTLAEWFDLELVTPPEDWLITLSPVWTQRKISEVRLDEVSGLSFPLFAKSRSPRLFTSRVFSNLGELHRVCSGMLPDLCLLVSEVVAFEAEARAFLLDGAVLDCATYHGPDLAVEARAFVDELVSSLEQLPETLVIDVGKIRGSGWAVIEANAAWGSASRGCLTDKILPCIAAASRASIFADG